MGDMDFLAQKQLEEQRLWELHEILDQLYLAMTDGYINEVQFATLQQEMGVTDWKLKVVELDDQFYNISIRR